MQMTTEQVKNLPWNIRQSVEQIRTLAPKYLIYNRSSVNIRKTGRQTIVDPDGSVTPNYLWERRIGLSGNRQRVFYKVQYRGIEKRNQRTGYSIAKQCEIKAEYFSGNQGPPGWHRATHRPSEKIRTRKKQGKIKSNHAGLRLPLCPWLQSASINTIFVRESENCNLWIGVKEN